MGRKRQMVVVRPSANLRTQSGVILLLIVMGILGLGAGLLLLAINTANSERSQRKFVSGSQALAAGKQALIGYAIGSLTGSGARPGWLPLPDTLANTNYNGQSDATSCLNGAATNGMPALSGVDAQVATLRCLGRLPWNDLGLAIDGASEQDLLGLVPWYAVSPNLADPNAGSGQCMTVLNPTTAALTATTFSCPTTTTPAWPWLKVCDNTGRILSDRVAAVLILPGEAIKTTGRTQLRTNPATGANPNGYGFPADFLDAVPTPAGWASIPVAQRCTTFDNAALSGEFIIADLSSIFNDQVVYITVDELMLEVERRVANEIREAIVKYKATSNGYPWLATLANPSAVSTSTLAVPGILSGLIPFATPPSVTSQKFLTELSWTITTIVGGDSYSLPATSSPQFFCYGGTYQCRLRTTADAAIPRTITTAEFDALKVSSISTPAASCSYTYDTSIKTINCDAYSYSQTSTVSYRVDRRPCSTPYVVGTCAGTRVFINNFSGTQTRNITVTFTVSQGSGSPASVPASSATTANRTVTTTNATALSGALSVTSESWVPAAAGTAPFDDSSGPFLPWTADSAGTGRIALTIRALPELPAWYLTQKWYEHMYAAISVDSTPSSGTSAACTTNCYSAGARTGLDAVVISAGPQIGAQNRYAVSPTVSDFLEAPNTTGTTTRTFADTTAARTSTYADLLSTIPR
ncbi:MAG: hypothetical protein ING33_10235 [Rhodocyclaceae bacterium]|nr:hypothetical protein [Rhodocyclaceae bacterium]